MATQLEVITYLDPPETGDFPVGSLVTSHATFLDPVTKIATDPTGSIIFKVGPPGALTTNGWFLDAPGQYHGAVIFTAPGKWLIQWAAVDGLGYPEGISTQIVTVYETGA